MKEKDEVSLVEAAVAMQARIYNDVSNEVVTGRLPAFKKGYRWFVKRADLEVFLAERGRDVA